MASSYQSYITLQKFYSKHQEHWMAIISIIITIHMIDIASYTICDKITLRIFTYVTLQNAPLNKQNKTITI